MINFVSRAILLLLAIQILNLSVNSIDFKPFTTSDFTVFNEINSIGEYVSEIVLGHINAYPEFQTKTQKQSQMQKHVCFKIINTERENTLEILPFFTILHSSKLKNSILHEYFNEINPPPPKA